MFGGKRLIDSKVLVEYSNDMDDVYKSIEEYITNKERKILVVFDDVIGNMLNNKNFNLIVTEIEISIRDTKINISLIIIT